MVERGGPSFDPEEEAAGVHEEVKHEIKKTGFPGHLYSRGKEDLIAEFSADPAVRAFLDVEPGVPEVERRGTRSLAALEAYAEKHKYQETRQQADARLDAYAKAHPLAEQGTPICDEVERELARARAAKSYTLLPEFLPADAPLGADLPPGKLVELPPASGESLREYRGALYAIHTALSLAHSLIHNETMRTPCGGRAWQTLDGFSERVRGILEAVSAEIEARAEGEGRVE